MVHGIFYFIELPDCNPKCIKKKCSYLHRKLLFKEGAEKISCTSSDDSSSGQIWIYNWLKILSYLRLVNQKTNFTLHPGRKFTFFNLDQEKRDDGEQVSNIPFGTHKHTLSPLFKNHLKQIPYQVAAEHIFGWRSIGVSWRFALQHHPMPSGPRTLCETSVWYKKLYSIKMSARRSLRPPANFLCSLLLFLLCWFNGADLVFLIRVILAVLVRHVWVFHLWSCAKRILYFRVISL